MPDAVTVEEWCKRHNRTFPGLDGIANDAVIRGAWKEVAELMAPFAKWEQVKKVHFLPAPLSIEGGELTPTLSSSASPS